MDQSPIAPSINRSSQAKNLSYLLGGYLKDRLRTCVSVASLTPLFLLGYFSMEATELSPWYSRYLEIQPKVSYAYQFYPSVKVANNTKKYSAHNQFVNMSLSGAYDRWSLELESNFAETRHRSWSFSDVRFTLRYQNWDDVLGDPFSLVSGCTVIQDVKWAKNDLSCFYHGCLESVFHIAAGKETSCEQFWVSHIWGLAAVGIADEGSPWLEGGLSWNHNGWDVHDFNISLTSLWGLGRNNLNLDKHFKGYGSISHYSIDLALNYHYSFEFGGLLGIEYTYRIYAHNCPSCVNTFGVNFTYPFGL